MTSRREIRREGTLENLSVFRDFVESECGRAGADAAACSSLKLAVDEACTNIIVHGYAGGAPGSIRLEFEDDGERLRVTITDHGRAFSPETLPKVDPAADWPERPLGGLGWHLIRQSIDAFEYRPGEESGNRLTLVKRKRSGS